MHLKNLGKFYTLRGLLDKLDVIECFKRPGKKLRVGEILEKQRLIFSDFDVPVPVSL